MSDFVSRADVIDAINVSWGLFDARKRVEAIPSADYSKPLQTTLNGGDLISRADAIDALGDEPEVWNDTDAEWAERDSWVLHKVAIESLPSAEAVEVVRCKDCIHCEPYKIGTDEDCTGLWCEKYQRDRTSQDFCSRGVR